MHVILIFYQFFSILTIFSSILVFFCGVPNFFLFLSLDNNLLCILYFRLPSFYNVLYLFLCQNAQNTNFLPIFLNFSQFLLILTNFGLILRRLYFFSIFFSINNNLSFVLYFRLSSFYNFLCIFFFQNVHITNSLLIFANFEQFWSSFGLILGRPYFVSIFF